MNNTQSQVRVEPLADPLETTVQPPDRRQRVLRNVVLQVFPVIGQCPRRREDLSQKAGNTMWFETWREFRPTNSTRD